MSALPRNEYPAEVESEALAGRPRSIDGALSPPSDHDFNLAPPQLVEVMCECGQSNCTGEISSTAEGV